MSPPAWFFQDIKTLATAHNSIICADAEEKLKRMNMWSNHIYFTPNRRAVYNTIDVVFMWCMHKYTGNTKACIEENFNHLTSV